MTWLLITFVVTAWTAAYVAYHDKAWVQTECQTIPAVSL